MDQFTDIKRYLRSLAPLPDSEIEYCTSLMSLRKMQAGEFFFQQGAECLDIGFSLSGLLYSYYTDNEGRTYVKKFNVSNSPVACYASLIMKKMATYSCGALDDSVICTINYEDYKRLYDRHPSWQQVGRQIAEKLYIEKELREHQLLTLSARERYDAFFRQYSELADKIPQYLIASYIGITPVALSRIRKN
jgi:CRP-like cAMP-binding protein